MLGWSTLQLRLCNIFTHRASAYEVADWQLFVYIMDGWRINAQDVPQSINLLRAVNIEIFRKLAKWSHECSRRYSTHEILARWTHPENITIRTKSRCSGQNWSCTLITRTSKFKSITTKRRVPSQKSTNATRAEECLISFFSSTNKSFSQKNWIHFGVYLDRVNCTILIQHYVVGHHLYDIQ